jgi:hypothetical protein
MASKVATAADTAETREDAAETPLLDTIAIAIKKMVEDGVARGTLPILARLLKRGSYGPLATLRPTEGPPIWTSVFTGRLPRDHGVKSFEAYRLRGSPTVFELLPKGALVSALERVGLVSTVPVNASSRKRLSRPDCEPVADLLPRVPFQNSTTGDQNCRCKFAATANGDEASSVAGLPSTPIAPVSASSNCFIDCWPACIRLSKYAEELPGDGDLSM